MSKKILALDLGIASVGWAISADPLKCESDLHHCGVRIFHPGMEKGKSGYESRTALRRTKRAARRLYDRRLRRKLALLHILVQHGMCPLPAEQLKAWQAKARGQQAPFPDAGEFIQWLRLCPYELRSRAAKQKVSAPELGRALYHIAQRRGFKSNRKDSSDKQGKDVELNQQQKLELEERGVRTLGELLYLKKQHRGLLRFRHSGEEESFVKSSRLTYEQEFEIIADTQGVDGELRRQLRQALFFQRPLKSQKHLVGKCVLEPERPRSPISAVECEEFGLYQILNNIKVFPQGKQDARLLSEEEKQLVIPLFLRQKRTFPAGDIQKFLKKQLKDKELRINYRLDQSLTTYPTMSLFAGIWGTKWREELRRAYEQNSGKPKTCEQAIQDVWHVLFHFDDSEKLREWGRQRLGFEGELLDKFASANLKEGYSKLSRYALQKIVPYLKRGLRYHEAVQVANLDSVFLKAGKETLWTEQQAEIVEDFLQALEQIKAERAGIYARNQEIQKKREEQYFDKSAKDSGVYALQKFEEMPSITARIGEFLNGKYQLPEDCCEQLYHHSAIEMFPAVKASENRLGSPRNDAIRNPLVLRALHELRRLVNCLLAEGKIDSETQILVEMSNEVNDNNTRKGIERFQKQRKDQRDEAVKELSGLLNNSHPPREDEILRYILWKEQDRICLYTGKQISAAQMLNGGLTDIEHTYPLSRVGNDARENKTLCFADFNRNKKAEFCPKELYEKGILQEEEMERRLKGWKEKMDSLEKKIESAKKASKAAESREKKDFAIVHRHCLRMELEYWKRKYKAFFSEIPTGFTQRNLVDARVINKYAKEYLKSYFKHVYTARGAQVSEFRKKLLNLAPRRDEALQEGKDVAPKDRDEHSHHMVDALSMCFLLPFLLQKQGRDMELKDFYRLLWRREHCDDRERQRIDEKLPTHRRKLLGWNEDLPLEQFVQQRRKSFLVSHENRVNSELRGLKKHSARSQLHKDTYYGAIKRPRYDEKQQVCRDSEGHVEFEEIFVKRSDVADVLNKFKGKGDSKDLNNIIDPMLRQRVQEILEDEQEFDLCCQQGYFDWKGQKVWRLRMREAGNYQPIQEHTPIGDSSKYQKHPYKQHIYADLRNNHHVQIFLRPDGKLEEDICSFWELTKRSKRKEPLYKQVPEGWKRVVCMQIGKLYLAGLEELQPGWEQWDARRQALGLWPHLYRVAKLSAGDYAFIRHNIASTFDRIPKEQVRSKFQGLDKNGKKFSGPDGMRLSSLPNVQKLNLCEVRIGPSGLLFPVEIR